MKLKYSTIPLFVAALSGCNLSNDRLDGVIDDGTDKVEQPDNGKPKPPATFNLTDITAKDANTLTYTWSGNSAGITYKVCQKNNSLPNSCDEQISVSNTNSADVSGLSVFEASKEDYFVLAENPQGATLSSETSIDQAVAISLTQYLKASNTESNNQFGGTIVLSDDGKTVAIGSQVENSGSTGVNGDENDSSANASGAVYVYRLNGVNWKQEAYIKASNTDGGDTFRAISISGDGKTLAVGARGEDSNSTGVNGDQSDNSASDSGAVYVFRFDGNNWAQEAYIKASNAGAWDGFGGTLSLSDDGNTLAVSATGEDSSASGIGGNESDNSEAGSGAVYVFQHDGINWSQQAYVKSSNSEQYDNFGISVSLSGDGSTLAVGATGEDSGSTGINGNQTDNSNLDSGAVYLFKNDGSSWSQNTYVKASNPDPQDNFGYSISLSSDGNTLAVGANWEDSNSTGVNGVQWDNTVSGSGAVYLFHFDGLNWEQEAYVKASNTDETDYFGVSVSLSGDGNTLAVGASREGSSLTGINGNQTDNSASGAGAVYLFSYEESHWTQKSYIKAPNVEASDLFGGAVSLSFDGGTLAAGAELESSSAKGVNGDREDNSQTRSGAAYIYK